MHEDPAAAEIRQDRSVLAILLDSPSPCSVEEIGRELGSRVAAVYSVGRLTGAGLLHKNGPHVWPTRAARRADELAG